MSHDSTLRAAYATFATGDLDGYLAYCTPDIRFTVPGRNQVAGTYDRDSFKSSLIPYVMRLSGGTFREAVLDVFTSDRGAIVHALHEFDGQLGVHFMSR